MLSKGIIIKRTKTSGLREAWELPERRAAVLLSVCDIG